MDHEQIKEIAEEVSEATVRKTFTALGIDMSNAQAIIQTQVDFAYLRRSRKVSERIGLGVRLSVIGFAVSGVLTMLWLGFKIAIKGS